MYCLFFYFSNSDLEKILEFSDFLNKWFEKYFEVKYLWNYYKSLKDLLENMSEYEKEANEKWWFTNWEAYNMIKFFDDSFYISVEISWQGLWYDENMIQKDVLEVEKKQREFVKEMLEKLPCLWVLSCFEENYEHFSKIFSKEVLEYSTFSAKKENWKIIFFEWKCDIDWFKRDIPTKKERIIWVTIYLTSIFLLFIFIIFVIYYLFKIFL